MKTRRIPRKHLYEWLKSTYPTSRILADATGMSRQAAHELLTGNVEPRVATLEMLDVEFVVPIRAKPKLERV